MSSTRNGSIDLQLALAIAAAVTFVLLAVYIKYLHVQLDACRDFKAQVGQLGRDAQRRAEEKEKADKALKEKTDARYLQVLRERDAAYQRLRVSASGSSLPAVTAIADQPDRICFSHGKLDAAIRAFTAGTAAIAEAGDTYHQRLTNAQEWAVSTPAATSPGARTQ